MTQLRPGTPVETYALQFADGAVSAFPAGTPYADVVAECELVDAHALDPATRTAIVRVRIEILGAADGAAATSADEVSRAIA